MPRTTRAAAKAADPALENEDTTATTDMETLAEDQASSAVEPEEETPATAAAPAKKSKSKKKGNKKKKAKANIASPDVDTTKEEEEQDDGIDQAEEQDDVVKEPEQQAAVEIVEHKEKAEPSALNATEEKPTDLGNSVAEEVQPIIEASTVTEDKKEQQQSINESVANKHLDDDTEIEKNVVQGSVVKDPIADATTTEEPESAVESRAETQVEMESEVEAKVKPVETIDTIPATQEVVQSETAATTESLSMEAPKEQEKTEEIAPHPATEPVLAKKASPKPKTKPTASTIHRSKSIAKSDAAKPTSFSRSTASRPSMSAPKPAASKLSQSTSTRPKSMLGEKKSENTDKPVDYLAAKRRPISMQFPTPPPPPRSSKPTTKPSFTLPGDAVAAKLKAVREERLKKEAEDDKKKKEFHARPVPASIKSTLPSVAVKQTAASKARMSIAGGSDKENAPSDPTTTKHVRKPSTATTTASKRASIMDPLRPSTSTISKRASIMGPPAAPKPRITSLASSVSSVGPRPPVKGKEVFGRDKVEKDSREKERKEKEDKTKKAREEAAERSRQMSREFRERQKRKAELANGGKKAEVAPAIVEA